MQASCSRRLTPRGLRPAGEKPIVASGLSVTSIAIGTRQCENFSTSTSPTTRAWQRELFPYGSALVSLTYSRDIKTINKTSVGKMQANGLKIAQSGAKMSWELVEEPALPKIRWARAFGLPDQPGSATGRQIVQMCCSIDSIQVSLVVLAAIEIAVSVCSDLTGRDCTSKARSRGQRASSTTSSTSS